MANSNSYPPLDPQDWPDRLHHMRDGFAEHLNIYRVMAHNPDLLANWNDLRQHLVLESALGAERLEVVILRVGARLGVNYEWSHHVGRSRAIGIEDARIFSIAGNLDEMTEDDATIARAVDELLDDTRLGPETLDKLDVLVGKAGVLDLMATVGFYKTLGCIAETFSVPLDEGVEEIRIP